MCRLHAYLAQKRKVVHGDRGARKLPAAVEPGDADGTSGPPRGSAVPEGALGVVDQSDVAEPHSEHHKEDHNSRKMGKEATMLGMCMVSNEPKTRYPGGRLCGTGRARARRACVRGPAGPGRADCGARTRGMWHENAVARERDQV